MACRRIVKLRRGLLLWPLVGPTRATARRALVSSTEVSENCILGSNAYSHCQPVAVVNREAIRTTSMMDDCHARALTALPQGRLHTVVEYIEEHLDGCPTLAQLAAVVRLNPYH